MLLTLRQLCKHICPLRRSRRSSSLDLLSCRCILCEGSRYRFVSGHGQWQITIGVSFATGSCLSCRHRHLLHVAFVTMTNFSVVAVVVGVVVAVDILVLSLVTASISFIFPIRGVVNAL